MCMNKVMDNITLTRIQQKVNTGLNCVASHAAVVVLVLLDILVITVLLLIDLCLPQDSKVADQCADGSRYERMRQAQFVIGIIQLTVLSGFVSEMIIRFLANIPSIVHDRWQVFDCLVVLVAFALYISLTVEFQRQTATYSAAYIISLRLWRIGRLYHDIRRKAAKHAEGMMHVHIRTATAYEELLKKSQHKVAVQKRQMERLQEAVLCLKSMAYSSLALSDNRTRSLPAVSQGHTEVEIQSLRTTPECPVQSENLLHMTESAGELAANPSCRRRLGSLGIPDILDNVKQENDQQGNPVVLGGNHLATECLCRHEKQNVFPCLNLKKRQSDVNLCSSLQSAADFNNETSITNFDLDPQVQALESYLQSLLNANLNSSYYNEAYVGESPTEEGFQHCPATFVQTQIQRRSDNVPSASVMPSVLSLMCTDDEIRAIERLSQVPFPFDHTRSYLSQDGIPMTDL